MSHLEVRSAARGALVCRQWYRAATPVAYGHIFLHTGSWTSASALSRTLLRCAHLRRHVKHITIIHCARYSPYMGNLLYAWLTGVPEGSLRSCCAIGGAALVGTLLASPAVRAARRLTILTLFYKASDDAVPYVEVLKCHPDHTQLVFKEHESPTGYSFLRGLLPHFRVFWGPSIRNTLYLSIASPAVEGGVALSELSAFLNQCLTEHLARANFVVLTLGYTARPIPTGRELCEEGLTQVTRRPSRCRCASTTGTSRRFTMDVSAEATAICVALLGGEPFSTETVRGMLQCMDSSTGPDRRRGRPPVWAHVAVLRVAGVPRGRACETCGVQLYAVFEPSFAPAR